MGDLSKILRNPQIPLHKINPGYMKAEDTGRLTWLYEGCRHEPNRRREAHKLGQKSPGQ